MTDVLKFCWYSKPSNHLSEAFLCDIASDRGRVAVIRQYERGTHSCVKKASLEKTAVLSS